MNDEIEVTITVSKDDARTIRSWPSMNGSGTLSRVLGAVKDALPEPPREPKVGEIWRSNIDPVLRYLVIAVVKDPVDETWVIAQQNSHTPFAHSVAWFVEHATFHDDWVGRERA